MEKENERDENYEASNPQIDSERKKDNYHTFARYCNYTEFINKRIEELNLPTKPRKDAVLMASFVIGSDREFFKGLTQAEQERFFNECTRYFAEKYGKENIISAVVHNDETTPHLHLNLMPIRNGRLCCKDLFNRTELTKLQTDFHEVVGKRWGLERGREGSPKRHLSTAEYKAKKIVMNACNEAADITENAQSELQQINQAVKKAEDHFDETIEQIHTAKTERDKIVAERDSEADYLQALEQAKNGEIAHGKSGLKVQVVALTVENKSLTEENTRLKKDNSFLLNPIKRKRKRTTTTTKRYEPLRYLGRKNPKRLQEFSTASLRCCNRSCLSANSLRRSDETVYGKSKKKSARNKNTTPLHRARTITAKQIRTQSRINICKTLDSFPMICYNDNAAYKYDAYIYGAYYGKERQSDERQALRGQAQSRT